MTSEYLDIMTSHSLLPAITRPTRIKHTSATLIDHIFTKKAGLDSCILTSDLAGSHGYTDHYPVLCFYPTKRENLNKTTTFTKKFFTANGHKTRREGLLKENWNNLNREKNSNKAYQILHDKYCEHYNSSLTIKTCTLGRNSPKEPWITTEIIRKMKKNVTNCLN